MIFDFFFRLKKKISSIKNDFEFKNDEDEILLVEDFRKGLIFREIFEINKKLKSMLLENFVKKKTF